MTESASGAMVAAYPYITDAAGGVWGLVPSLTGGALVCHNGSVMTGTTNTTQLLYLNHKVYRQNASGTWFVRSGGMWTATTSPVTPPVGWATVP